MQMTVRLFAGLRRRAGAPSLDVEVPEDGTVADLLSALDGTPLGGLPARAFIVAVNRAYADGDVAVRAGDEVALIPPVSGGAADPEPVSGGAAHPQPVSGGGADPEPVRAAGILEGPLDGARLALLVRDPRAGAVVVFEGMTREVAQLEYEAYAEMAEPMLRAIAAEEAARHGLVAVAVEHRVGTVPLSEPSVIVAVAAAHRGEAFAGARAVIDRLKAEAPIFKQQEEVWVEGTLPEPRPAGLASPDGVEGQLDDQRLNGQQGEHQA